MSAALFIALSVAVSGGCAAFSWRHPSRVARAISGDARELARALRALPAGARLPELSRRSPPESWERRLALALMDDGDPRAKVAAANDLLLEIAQRLDVGAGWPPAAARLSALGALLLATLSFLAHAGSSVIVAVLGAGAAGAVASAAAGRAGREAAERQRAAIDALVDAVLGPSSATTRAARAPREALQRPPRAGR